MLYSLHYFTINNNKESTDLVLATSQTPICRGLVDGIHIN